MSNIDYNSYIKQKEESVKKAFVNVSQNINITPIFKNRKPLNYRHKSTLSAINIKGKIRLGLFIPKTKQIKPIKNDTLVDEGINSLFILIEEILQKYKILAYDKETPRGVLKHVTIRKSFSTNDLIIVFVTETSLLPNQKLIIKDLISIRSDIKSVVQIIQNKETKYVGVGSEKLLYGPGFIVDKIENLSFNISASSFYQVNPYVTKDLYLSAILKANIKKNDVVFDCYSGVGTLTLLISQYAEKVYGVEINESAHKNALMNKKNNKITNVNFILGDANDLLVNAQEQPTIVFVDPTKAGLSNEFIDSIKKALPQKLIYISCNYETQIRDIKKLDKLYDVKYIQAFDMFSHTEDLETLVILEKKKLKK